MHVSIDLILIFDIVICTLLRLVYILYRLKLHGTIALTFLFIFLELFKLVLLSSLLDPLSPDIVKLFLSL